MSYSRAFELVCHLNGLQGDGPDGHVHEGKELVRAAERDPDWYLDFRSHIETVWREQTREVTRYWFELLVETARYLSDLLDAEIPVLVPRDVAEASTGCRRAGQEEPLLLGKALQRSIAASVAHNVAESNKSSVEEFKILLAERRCDVPPAESRWLSTRDMAARLAIDEVTAARLCKKGLIDAEKTAGGQWRTTEDRLRWSKYLNGQTRQRRRAGKKGDGAVE